MHRAWTNIKSTITGMNEHAVLGECERGEDTATSSTLITENVPSPGDIALRPPASFHSHLRRRGVGSAVIST
jgi:Domain of unknown function (DUF2383)